MKTRKPDALKLACILLAAVLAAGAAGLIYLRSGMAMTRSDEVSQRLQDLQFTLSFGGAEAVQRAGMQDAAQWLGSENGNLILMDQKGAILHSLNGSLLDGATSLRLVVSPHFLGRYDSWSFGSSALALILDGNGQIVHPFLMPQGPYNTEEDMAVGRGDPAYAQLFPDINRTLYRAYADYLENGPNSFGWDGGWEEGGDWAAYAEMSGDEAPATAVRREEWMENYQVLLALAGGATQADVDKVKRYCEWERDQLRQAGQWCAQLTRSDDGGLYALALYENNGATNRAYDQTVMRWQNAGALFPFWAFGLVVLILLTAFWVLQDARRRDFRPALWGILTLLGNVVTLIVYLIVRPANSRCPSCGALVKRSYLVCPMCAAPLRARCPGCGRPQESAWVCCPYCGQGRGSEKAAV